MSIRSILGLKGPPQEDSEVRATKDRLYNEFLAEKKAKEEAAASAERERVEAKQREARKRAQEEALKEAIRRAEEARRARLIKLSYRQQWLDAAFAEHHDREPWVVPTIDRHKLVYLAVKFRPEFTTIDQAWNDLDPVFEFHASALRSSGEAPMSYRELGIYFETVVVSPYYDDLEQRRKLRYCHGIWPSDVTKRLRNLMFLSRALLGDRMDKEPLPYNPRMLG